MEIKTYDELVAPDERNTSLGFVEARRTEGFDIRAAARRCQEYVSTDLRQDVPDTLRASFDRVRKTFTYGLFDYELFTAANDLAILLLEQALKERFVTLYDHEVTLVSKSRQTVDLQAHDFEVVYDYLNPGGSRATGSWTVRLRSGEDLSLVGRSGKQQAFRGHLWQLLEWARQERLLDGQWTRQLNSYLIRERIRVAHGTYHLTMPLSAARQIRDMAETINRLWGYRTPGGHLYPGPLRRSTVVVAWADEGNLLRTMRPDQVEQFDGLDWTYIVLLAVEDDETLECYDARFERTRYPAEWLWGPVSRSGLLGWLAAAELTTDEVEHRDQLVAIQEVDGKTYLPRRASVALGLPPRRRSGRWHLFRADLPLEAFAVVKDGRPGAVQPICDGSWEEMAQRLRELGVTATAAANVWVPGRWCEVAPDVGAD